MMFWIRLLGIGDFSDLKEKWILFCNIFETISIERAQP